MHALVVDDSKPVRGILARMLRDLNFETTKAENGQQALNCLQTIGVPDLILVNWNMPVVDGLQFIRAVRADPRQASVPLVVVSGDSDRQTIDRALAAGANDFLVKPFTEQSLRKMLVQFHFPDPVGRTDRGPTDQKRVSQSAGSSAPLGVMIVDDSVVVRGVISKVLAEEPDLKVVATAADGRIAMGKIPQVKPDVILLDVEMPNMNGFEMLKELRKTGSGVPVIMFSSITEHGARATIEALMLGARDYVPKPGGAKMSDTAAGMQAIREELIPKIKQFANRSAITRLKAPAVPIASLPKFRPPPQRTDIVAIGLSTGGPQALAKVLPMFAPECPVPIVIVQHMPPMFTKHLAERLTSECNTKVDEATEGQSVEPGCVLIAPGGFHMRMTKVGTSVKVRLTKDPPVNACRPSVDVLFESVGKVYRAGTLAVVLTGMGDDGAKGCQGIYEAGGRVIVQDESSSVVWGMPSAVVRAGAADEVLPLKAIGAEISRRVWERRTKDSGS